MKTTYTIDLDEAKDALNKEELQIFSVLLNKIQDHTSDFSDGYEDESEDEFRKRCGLPPLHYFNVFLINGQEKQLNSTVAATDEAETATAWCKENNLEGALLYSEPKDLWLYEGAKVCVEKIE
ncbi:hypothetical protein MOC90_05700 [Bacillus spizizenii]|nr:hypothetical protein [Bacillus spizizenii]MCY8219305.1 hypothetical protein [Bacillus spizizenii]MCY8362029.1 hypothetical protein [Bacillus spizizenii]MCY8368302.1 hypothetical protein [Bacillus spizizenii]